MTMAVLRGLFGLWLLAQTTMSMATLNIEIIGAGENQIPIAIVPFGGDEKLAQSISEVVAGDLRRSGLFRLVDPAGKSPHEPAEVNYADWQVRGAEALAIGTVETQPNGRIEARFRLLDAVKETELAGQAVSASENQIRAIGHRIADLIYEKLTGDKGVFSTRIVYVNRQGKKFSLVVADSDGHNEQAVLTQNEPIMSPAWSPDGSHLAYVSFETGHAAVYVQSLYTNQRAVLANYPGSNSAPAWSPDGKQLAVVLTRDGSSQIYLVRPDGSGLRRLSFSGTIDTEPNFSPDGQYLLFTSDRGGSAQVYRMPVDGGAAQRMTFDEGTNFSPRHSPDGKSFVFSHLFKGKFYIAVRDFQTGQMSLLTEGGWEKRPSFAPNGKLILFASEARGRGILATVSSDGRVKQHMFTQSGDAREPMWGPYP
ncbi:MAG: Tol-Pal system beta propeller repeat protein TolB [Gallionellales bacterium RIFCSPLOWO2_12_FULL_59_22]|nr:MAG: Tol-Pal system beta propeller repeat protein TolB [Gallionellales bacterium RIFCSPLOWO2_02_FULL_59_110]OGT05031.1 MAG: Tol-Pal system beta propeller repeat protein TolB [Gallionellales bacterium RIFCSPLOWO2_02_58_13]OGT12538.1 MAG: Tol-Pal system beta propeller repeat protein TolB [Gallionellales bacterium RIFCSPLOWO2_12_FULL_59_22]